MKFRKIIILLIISLKLYSHTVSVKVDIHLQINKVKTNVVDAML